MDFCHQKNQDHPSSVVSTSLHCPLHNHDEFQKMNNVSISMTDYSEKFACQHNNWDMMITFPTVRFKAIETHIDRKYRSCQNQLIHSGNVLVISKSQGICDNSGKDLTGKVWIQPTSGSIRQHDCRICHMIFKTKCWGATLRVEASQNYSSSFWAWTWTLQKKFWLLI